VATPFVLGDRSISLGYRVRPGVAHGGVKAGRRSPAFQLQVQEQLLERQVQSQRLIKRIHQRR
jgi:hypothetical protein